MTGAHSRPTGRHRGLVATVLTGLLALSGLTCLGVAVTNRQLPTQPSPSTGDSPSISTRDSTSARDPAAAVENRAEPTAPVVGPVLPESNPVAVIIPAIGVSSPLQRLGLAADGSLEVPAPGPRYDEAGWYRFSPAPGSLGPAVIVGHVDSATTGPSVFARLGRLGPRDRVRVTRADGSVAIFEVDDVRHFRKARFPTRLVYGNTDHAALRLITCGGPIDPVSGHYLENVVVLASLVGPSA